MTRENAGGIRHTHGDVSEGDGAISDGGVGDSEGRF